MPRRFSAGLLTFRPYLVPDPGGSEVKIWIGILAKNLAHDVKDQSTARFLEHLFDISFGNFAK